MDKLQNIHDVNSSLSGNVETIRKRLNPQAFLLVKCSSEIKDSVQKLREAYHEGDGILSALCMASLFNPLPLNAKSYIIEPTPIFRARYLEACDLPLVFDEKHLHVTGHSSSVNWITAIGSLGLIPQTVTEFTSQAMGSFGVISKLLNGERISRREERLEAAMRALHAAFQATSIGQFIAESVSAVEQLIAKKDDPWKIKISRLRTVVGDEYSTRVDEIVKARHEYVHTAKQPEQDYLAQSALAMVVQAWAVVHELFEQIESIQDAIKYLDCCHLAQQTTSNNLNALRKLCDGIAPGPVRGSYWTHKYLVDSPPNEYRKKYVVNGHVACPKCDNRCSSKECINDEGATKTYRCNKCGEEWMAHSLK